MPLASHFEHLIHRHSAFSEFKLISCAFTYELATDNRLKRLAFDEAIPKTQLKDVMGGVRYVTPDLKEHPFDGGRAATVGVTRIEEE